MEENHIYQYSLLNALMDGVSETGITVKKLISKGNHGLGTFVRMDGELLLLDGKVYQLRANGNIREAGPDDQIPFAVSTNFVPQLRLKVKLEDKSAIDRILDKFEANARNLFITYRIEGVFKRLKCRTVKGQEYKGQPLSELGDKQFVDTYETIDGTIVGFRSPSLWQGLAVAGEHLHFIDKDRKKGGHVLEITAEDVEMQIAVASNIHIELPTDSDFNNASLALDDAGIKKVEG